MPISNSKNKVTVLPAPALPSKCSASGPGLAGGQANTYLPVLIELRDQFGNELLSNGNHSLTATFRHAQEVLDGTVDITNNNNGSYSLKVSGRKSGEWKLSVQVCSYFHYYYVILRDLLKKFFQKRQN